MAEPIRPNAESTYGRDSWFLLDSMAGSAPTVAEMTASSTLDVTRIVLASGSAAPSQSTNSVTEERRIGDTTVPQQLGTTTLNGGDWTYAVRTQDATGSDGKKLLEKIGAGGVSKVLVRRLGIGRAVAPVAGQFVLPWNVTFGPTNIDTAGDGETGQSAGKCTYVVTSATTPALVAIAA